MTRTEKLVEEIKNEILGKEYNLSLVFISKNKIKFLNNKYRKKNEATDILSFSLDKNLGEIFICKEIAKAKSIKFEMSPNNYLLFLVIHGILHLKGFVHSVKMESNELKYYSRYRHRHL